MTRTPAQEQLEHLKRLKQEQAARPAAKAPLPPSPTPSLSEPARRTRPKGSRRRVTLEVDRADWRAFLEQRAQGGGIRSKKALADWFMELLLRLPPGSHRMSRASKDELFARIDEWFKARGWG